MKSWTRRCRRVMAHLEMEAGEIFLLEEGERELRLALHRGGLCRGFLRLGKLSLGEGFIGIVAQTGKPLVTHRFEE